MCLEGKKRKAKSDYLFWKINCKKECKLNFFKDSNESSKVLRHREMYGWCFWRLNDIDKNATLEVVKQDKIMEIVFPW